MRGRSSIVGASSGVFPARACERCSCVSPGAVGGGGAVFYSRSYRRGPSLRCEVSLRYLFAAKEPGDSPCKARRRHATMLAHARLCCSPLRCGLRAMSVRPAIPAHGDQNGQHTMPCSRRAPPPHGPALHGTASFEAPALLGVCLSVCSASQQPAAREGSHSACPVPCMSAPLPPVSGSHCCGPLVLLPAVFMQASPCGHLAAASAPHTAHVQRPVLRCVPASV